MTRTLQWCTSCSSLNESLIQNGYFPSQSKEWVFLLAFLEDHRKYNQHSGVPCYATSSILLGKGLMHYWHAIKSHRSLEYQPALSNYIELLFRDAYYNYVILMIRFERMDFVGDSWQVARGQCPACPKDGESGPLYLAADGCFSLARLTKASGTTTRQSELDGFFFSGAFNASPGIDRSTRDTVDEDPCSNFAAAGPAFRRHKSSTLDEKGVFGICCARHGTPLCFIDMFGGECYDYCDQVLHMLLKGDTQRKVYLFYDIACKYGKSFRVSSV